MNKLDKKTNQYYRLMKPLKAKDVFEGFLLHGFFHEKLDIFFSSKSFYDFYLNKKFYCDFKKANESVISSPRKYINYNTTRNIGIPRKVSIPNPFAYLHLTNYLAYHYETTILPYIWECVKDNTYRVSRVHIQKIKGKKSIFEMNYQQWKIDGSPEDKLLLGKSIMVEADIASFFPSIYSHSLAWAGIGKNRAKKETRMDEKKCQQILLYGIN